MFQRGIFQAAAEIVIAALVAADAVFDRVQLSGLSLVAEFGIRQLGAGHDHKVRLVLHQDILGHLRRVNPPAGHRQQTGLPADTCGRLHVEAVGNVHRCNFIYGSCSQDVAPGDIQHIHTNVSGALAEINDLFNGQAAFQHIILAVYPHEQGHPLRHIGPNRLNTGQRKLFAVFKAATPSVCAPVDPARKERMRQIVVCTMELNDVDPGFYDAAGRLAERFNNGLNALLCNAGNCIFRRERHI